jgi:endonuclease YncB( thermonuclease family)
MPFITIQGTYHLAGRSQNGTPTGFEPDGDSIQFKPTNTALLDQLRRVGDPYELTRIGSVNLRLEGIDALELHYSKQGPKAHQPRPLADHSRDFLTEQLGMNPVPYAPPRNIRVRPPVPVDAVPGYILARNLEVYGRPVSFAFLGLPPDPDGTPVFLSVCRLEQSLNYQLIQAGHAYPLFYDTLFADLRLALASAARRARKIGVGIWASDTSASGVQINSEADLQNVAVIFPKLFRRLLQFMRVNNTTDLSGFLLWVASEEDEQVLDLAEMNFTHFDNVLSVTANRIEMLRRPEELIFISKKRMRLD